MSFQVINDLKVYVVDLVETPDLPIRSGGDSELAPYAIALTHALKNRTIIAPGKFAIYVDFSNDTWLAFEVKE